MAANSDYVSTFTTVLETVRGRCEELCQTFLGQGIENCAQLYEQDKDTLQFPRKKQNYSPNECCILLAAGQIMQIQGHVDNITLVLTEIDKSDLEAMKNALIAGPGGAEWKKLYDSNRAQFKCDKLKKLWDAVVVTRLLVSQFDGVKDLAGKISLSAEQIDDVNRSLQYLSLSLHPNSSNYYAKDIGLLDKFAARFFKKEVRNISSSPNSAKSIASQSSPLNVPRNRDSQLSSLLLTQSAPSGNSFFNLLRTISDISLPSSDEVSDEEENIAGSGVIKRPLTPVVPRNGQM